MIVSAKAVHSPRERAAVLGPTAAGKYALAVIAGPGTLGDARIDLAGIDRLPGAAPALMRFQLELDQKVVAEVQLQAMQSAHNLPMPLTASIEHDGIRWCFHYRPIKALAFSARARVLMYLTESSNALVSAQISYRNASGAHGYTTRRVLRPLPRI